ncbi:MAG: type II toxin-antitoxin system HicA family toxin [Candidatus Hydrogenedentes bacterium]|nr:type II toxin-antitoxin system HicA family toxin [Candidatus Hydrogenedentota bacterium]
MKRQAFLKHLQRHGCAFVREGGRHSWWGNPKNKKRSAVPRHAEIDDDLCRKICKDMAIPPPPR